MSVGALIRIVECIVTSYCGVQLAVRPCKMRWNHVAAKVIMWGLIAAGTVVECANTFWGKYSSIMTLVLSIYLFLILLIFYRIHVLQLLAQNFCYWMSLMVLRHLVVSICAMLRSESIYLYIDAQYGQSWHWLQIVSMLVTLGIVVALLYSRKDKALIQCRMKRGYVIFICIALAEILIEQYLFTDRNLKIVKGEFLLICMLLFWALISFVLVFFIYSNYQEVRYHEKMMDMSLRTLQNQYTLLQESYIEKRKQIHDAIHHDVLLIGYLREGDTEKALRYLENKLEQSRATQKNHYTGIEVIDLMLDYKINEAKKYDISVSLDADVYFCPIEDTEMCILLGNLLDNAMEAVRQLPLQERKILVFMRIPNDMFILEMKNPYKGKRRKVEGHYRTTKQDKESHGFGLDSVKQIVEKHGGYFEISDDGKEFIVNLCIFKDKFCKFADNLSE